MSELSKKPEAPGHDPVFRNTFAPQCDNDWLMASNIVQGLKMGLFRWKLLPEEVQKGVRTYMDSPQFKETLV